MGVHTPKQPRVEKSEVNIIYDKDDTLIYFDKGNFDDWCIYLEQNGNRLAPTDTWYFSLMKSWTKLTSAERIYDDFVTIYDLVTPIHSPDNLEVIEDIASAYPDWQEASVVFTILYMGMLAEENKAGKILGKKIKRLGVYQVLLEDVHPHDAANYSRGLKADYLLEVCKFRGF